MDGWMNEWMNGRMNEWMNRWMNEWIDGWMNEWMNALMGGWMDELMNGRMSEWMNERMNECMDEWMNGWVNEWMVLIIKNQLDAPISQICIWNKTLHVSDSSSVHHQQFFTVHTAVHTGLLTACEQDQNFPSWSCSQAVSKRTVRNM